MRTCSGCSEQTDNEAMSFCDACNEDTSETTALVAERAHAAGYAEAVAAVVKMFLDDAANASVMAERADRDDSPNDVEDWARERAYNETAAKKVSERFAHVGAAKKGG